MFNSIQKNIYSWVVIFIFIIITIIFIITIIPLKNKENNRSTFIAKVDQHIINITEFNKLYNNAILELNGSNLNDNHKQIIKEKLKTIILNQLINNELLYQLAVKNNFAISDKKLARTIVEHYLNNNKLFIKKNYETMLFNYKMTAKQFENKLRKNLITQEIYNIIKRFSFISNAEILQNLKLNNYKIALNFIKIDPNLFYTQNSFSNQSINNFINNNIIKIKMFYSKYNQLKIINVKHILIKAAFNSNNKNKKEALTTIKKIKKILEKNNFDTIAEATSECPNNKYKGQLGYMNNSIMIKPISKLLFNLKKNEISKIIESPLGYHLIKIEDIQEPLNIDLNALTKIAKTLMTKKTQKNNAKQYAKQLMQKLENNTKIKTLEIIENNNKNIKSALYFGSTENFSYNENYIPYIGKNKKIMQIAFSLTLKTPLYKKIIEKNNNFFIIKLKSKKYTNKNNTSTSYIKKQRKQKFFNEYLSYLIKETKIKYYQKINK